MYNVTHGEKQTWLVFHDIWERMENTFQLFFRNGKFL